MQRFKASDTEELKYYESAAPAMDLTSNELDAFATDAYTSQALGDLLYESNRAPLTNSVLQRVFRSCFSEVFAAFRVAGSFDSYITVFKKIFGEDVEITFTVPAPGKLEIDIVATGIEINDAIFRQIESNAYVNYEFVDYDGDNIVFQSVKGFESQYELETMLFEMVPAGIFTTITLTVGA